jgi:CubicO group peptidase (beta-lactamase class C family)
MTAAAKIFCSRMRGLNSSFLIARIFLVGVVFLQAGCAGYTSRAIVDPTVAATRLRNGGEIKAEVDALALPLIRSQNIHDVAIGVLTPDGQPHFFNYSIATNDVPGSNTLFQIGSLTKVFVAGLLTILVDEGRLSYDDTVRSILPPDVKVSPELGDVTLGELADHTSGLPREPHTFQQLRFVVAFVFGGINPYQFITKDYLYDYIAAHRVPPKAERKYNYSNLGYGLLAHLIEIKTRRSLPDLIREKICRPLNLRDTVFVLSPEQRTRVQQGHAGDEPRFWPRNVKMNAWDMGEIMRASGEMYSTTADLMTFAKSNLGLLGSPLDPLLARNEQVQVRAPGEDITYGWMINHYPEWGANIQYMNGVMAGFSSYLGLETDKKLAVVVLYSNFNWQDKIGHNLLLRLANSEIQSAPATNSPAVTSY